MMNNSVETSNDFLIKWRVATSNLDIFEQQSTTLQKDIDVLEKSIDEWSGAKQLLEHLKNHKLEKRKDFILTVINSALKDIFESDYRLDIQPKDNKGTSVASTQKYDIIFFQNNIEIARNDDLLASNGGGVLSIASLFFKILIGYLYSKNKFYIFDEALSQVSPQYRSRLSKFLQVFCAKYDFTIVVVSQTEELETHADLVYEVGSSLSDNNIPILEIVEVKGEYPTENYFYSKVKNFQSITDQTFIYKGFTIIRGPNNSGKSAALRAIDAVLFNNFNTDIYPRKNPDGPKLTTEITFGFAGKEGDAKKEIGLKYKAGKVMFVIDGHEYFGKSLAADKLKEAVEEIGFRYIDVKKMYKNFKGALKDQTERIAYTNQYDGLFLIGAKTSDSEKIFSFLFNTENIALAIAQAKEAIQEFGKEHKLKSQALIQVSTDLNKAKINVDYFLKLYYYYTIHEFIITESSLNTQRKNLNAYQDVERSIKTTLEIINDTLILENTTGQLSTLRNKEEYNNTQIGLIENTLSVMDATNTINSFIHLENTRQNYQTKINVFDQLIPNLQGIIQFDYFITLGEHLHTYKESIDSFNISINTLSSEYNLCECTNCNGLGVQPSNL